MDVKQKLDKLADMYFRRDQVTIQKQKVIDSVLTPEIKKQIADIELEFASATDSINDNIGEIEAEIKNDVIQLGETVKSEFVMAVWSKPRVSWDTKALDGYAIAHPEIAVMRKEGLPSVSLRLTGK